MAAGPRRASVRGAPVYTAAAVVRISESAWASSFRSAGPVYTHDGNVDYDDPMFAGDELYVSMTLVSTYDGRVLWHTRDNVDLEADRPDHIEQLVHAFIDTLPPALPRAPAAAAR